MEKQLRSSQIVIAYSRNLGIRKKVFDFEEALADEFKTPFRTVAVPDEIDPNIPRFESQSKHNHSQLQVSQNRISLGTNFDGKLDRQAIKEYLTSKRKSISNLAKSENIHFTAYVLDLAYILPEEEINDILKKNTGAFAVDKNCRDFTLLYSRVYKENYYLNITCSKFSEKEIIIDPENNQVRETENIRHGISIKVDLNTKYYFEKSSKFDNDLYYSLEEILFDLINKKELNDYLKGNI